MLFLLLGCAFVEPEPPPIVLEPPQAALDAIDKARQLHQQTDAGAELWRCIDAHGGLLRWERVGPLVAVLSDGTEVAPSHADYPRLTLPFSMGYRDTAGAVIEPGWVVRVGSDALSLNPDSRRLARFTDSEGDWLIEETQTVQGLLLPTVLTSEGRRIDVAEWRAAHPIPGL